MNTKINQTKEIINKMKEKIIILMIINGIYLDLLN